jgi:hypothetical protein
LVIYAIVAVGDESTMNFRELQHLAMMLRQQAPWEDENLFDRPAQKDSGVRKKGAL